MNLTVNTTQYKVHTASLFLSILVGFFLIIIIILALTNSQGFFLYEKINIQLGRKAYASLFVGWGHFLLNALLLILISFLEFKKRQNWLFFVFFSASVWVGALDFLATRLYLVILPTPVFPIICWSLSLWISRASLFIYKKKPFRDLSLKAKQGTLYGLSLFALAVVSLLGAVNNKFIPVDLPYSGSEKSLLLAATHVGWANLSGYGIIIIYLFNLEDQLKPPSLSTLINVFCALSFLILLVASVLESSLLFYFFIPMLMSAIILFSDHFFNKHAHAKN